MQKQRQGGNATTLQVAFKTAAIASAFSYSRRGVAVAVVCLRVYVFMQEQRVH